MAMVDEFSVCTLKSALPNDPPGFTLGRVFFVTSVCIELGKSEN